MTFAPPDFFGPMTEDVGGSGGGFPNSSEPFLRFSSFGRFRVLRIGPSFESGFPVSSDGSDLLDRLLGDPFWFFGPSVVPDLRVGEIVPVFRDGEIVPGFRIGEPRPFFLGDKSWARIPGV